MNNSEMISQNSFSFNSSIETIFAPGHDYTQFVSSFCKNSWNKVFNKISMSSFESNIPNEETLYLISIPNMKESILKGLNTSVEECETDLEW